MTKTIPVELKILKSFIFAGLTVVGTYVFIWLISVGSLFAQSLVSLNGKDPSGQTAYSLYYSYTHKGPEWQAFANAIKTEDGQKKFIGDYIERGLKDISSKTNIKLDFSGMSAEDKLLAIMSLEFDKSKALAKAKEPITVHYYGNQDEIDLGTMPRKFIFPVGPSSYKHNVLPEQVSHFSVSIEKNGGKKQFTLDIQRNQQIGALMLPETNRLTYDLTDSLQSKSLEDFLAQNPKLVAQIFEKPEGSSQMTLSYLAAPTKMTKTQNILIVTPDGQQTYGSTVAGLGLETHPPKGAVYYVRGMATLSELIQKLNTTKKPGVAFIQSLEKKSCPI